MDTYKDTHIKGFTGLVHDWKRANNPRTKKRIWHLETQVQRKARDLKVSLFTLGTKLICLITLDMYQQGYHTSLMPWRHCFCSRLTCLLRPTSKKCFSVLTVDTSSWRPWLVEAEKGFHSSCRYTSSLLESCEWLSWFKSSFSENSHSQIQLNQRTLKLMHHLNFHNGTFSFMFEGHWVKMTSTLNTFLQTPERFLFLFFLNLNHY